MDQPLSADQPGTQAPARQLIANPVPVGVAGFALTTFLLGLYNSGIWHDPNSTTKPLNALWVYVILGLAAFYGGLTQFIAGFFSLRRGDIFQAAFMTSYGAFWWSFDFLFFMFLAPTGGLFGDPSWKGALAEAGMKGDAAKVPAATSFYHAVTIFLIGWTIITIIFFLASLFTNWVVAGVFAWFVFTLVVADIAFSGGPTATGAGHFAGWLEIILGCLGWYVVLSEMVNDLAGREIFPFPLTPLNAAKRKAGRDAVTPATAH